MLDWRWDFTFEIMPRMLWATLNTLMAAGIGYAIAIVLGLVLALAQRTPYRPLTLVVRDASTVDNVLGLRTWARSAQSQGYLCDSDVTRWERLFDETVAVGRFCWSVTFFLTTGTKSI